MDETVAAAIRMLHTELDALEVVRQHPDMPQPPAEAVALVAHALGDLAAAQRLLESG